MSHPACVQFLRDYVAIPSVNPMRRDDIPAEVAGERRYASHLREQLRRLGLDAEVLGDGRPRERLCRGDGARRDATRC